MNRYMALTRDKLVLLIVGAVAFTAIFLTSAVALMPKTALLLVVGFLGVGAVFACLQRPTWAIWLILGLLFFGDRSDIPQLVFLGRYLPTIGVALFVFSVMLRRLLAGNWAWRGIIPILSYTFFTLLVLMSAVFNHSTIRDILLSLATNLRYPLFFVILLNVELPPSFYHRVLKAFVALGLLQIPVTIIQFTLLGQKGDFLTGTLGANGSLVAVALSSQFVLTAMWLSDSKRKWYYPFVICALLIPCLLADVQIALVFFPLVATFMLLSNYGLRRLGRVIRQSVMMFLFSIVILLVAVIAIPSVRKFVSLIPLHVQELTYTRPSDVVYSSAGRITIMRFALPMLLENPLRIIWGFGPEATYGGSLTASFKNRMSGTVSDVSTMGIVCQKLVAIDSGCREPQSFRAVMDFGLLGSALYIFPQLLLWWACIRIRHRLPSPESRVVPLLFEGLCSLYIVFGMWYIGVWRLDSYSFIFWLTAAAVFAEQRAYTTTSALSAREGS